MQLQDWRYVAASVIGTSHTKTSAPCQDYHASAILDGTEQVLVLIAADGAGSASHSEYGSSLACQEMLDSIRLFLADGNAVSDVTREVALGWLENAAASIAQTAMRGDLASRDYASTLLVAIVSPTHSAFLQIGDGAIVIRPSGDDWAYVFWPQHGEYINTTVFLTDPQALANFEFCMRPDQIHEVAVFTDGIEPLVLHYATQSVHNPFFDAMFPAVRSLPNAGYNELLSRQLEVYLASPAVCDRTDDDKTLLIATRLLRPPSRSLILIE